MTEPRYKTRREPNRRPLIVIGVIAALLVLVVLLLSGGKDDPVVDGLVPPINTAATGTTGVTTAAGQTVIDSNGNEIPATAGAVDGKGVAAAPQQEAPKPSGDPHEDESVKEPAGQAADVGPYVDTATRFAELNLNRSTDAAAAADLNKQLVRLSTGTLARDLEAGTGEVQTAQVASTGSVLDSMPLTKQGDYAEVLIIAKQTVVDPQTGQELDPKYLNYLVRLEKVPGRGFAVTSWEPQI